MRRVSRPARAKLCGRCEFEGSTEAHESPACEVVRAAWRRAAFREGEGRALRAGVRGRDGGAAGRARGHRRGPVAADLREHDRGARGRGPDARRRRDHLRHLVVDHERPRVPGGRARGSPPSSPRSRTRSRRTRSSSRASRRSTLPPEKAKLTPEQQRLTWRRYTTLVRAGAKLDAPSKKRIVEINQRLASLYTTFSQNVLADEEGYVLLLDKEADLAGLPESTRAGAAAAAEARGAKGKWAITNTRSSMEPFLTYSTRDDLREKVWQELRQPRRQRRRARQQEDHLRDPEAPRRAREAARLRDARALAPRERDGEDAGARDGADGGGLDARRRARPRRGRRHAGARERGGAKRKIAPWDYRFYAEKVRKAKYDLDENEVKPYLQLEKLREGMFWVAGELLGFAFTPVTDVEVYHPDVRVWEVKDKATGKHVGLWYFDPYARPGKRSGAWMQTYRRQERFQGAVTTIVEQQLELREGRRGRAGPHQLGRGAHALPRVRSRAPRPELGRDLPDARRHAGRARLRRVPVAAPRALGPHARGARALRAALPDGRADAAGARREDREGRELQPGLRHRRVPERGARRHEAPPRGRAATSTPTPSSATRWRRSACPPRS